MDLSNFVTFDKKEARMLSIAKSNLGIVEKTHSKPQETLEIEMTKRKESFSFDVPLELNEKWMMGVTNLEVYNLVYNTTLANNKLQFVLTKEQAKELRIDTQLITNKNNLYVTYDLENDKQYYEFIEKN